MLSTRCSSLDRNLACAGSLAKADHPYNPQSDEAREGTAGHAGLAHVVRGEQPDLEAIAAEHRVGRDALTMLMARGNQAWEQVRHRFPDAAAEVPLQAVIDDVSKIKLTGTADVISLVGDTVAVLDWKCGWKPSEHPHQLRGYAYLGVRALEAESPGILVGDVVAVEAHLRVGVLEVHRWSRADLETWAHKLVAQTRRVGTQWGPGPVACQYCPHQTSCAARDEYVQSAATALAPMASPGGSLTPEEIVALWDRSRELKRALATYEQVVGEILRSGAVPLDATRQLCWVESTRDKILPAKAMRYLRETLRLTPEEANLCLRVSKGKLCDIVKSRVQKGKGAGAVRELLAALKTEEAIIQTPHKEKGVIKRPRKES
jgi:hypothetical protein